MPVDIGGGSFVAGLIGQVGANLLASPMNVFTQGGNYVYPTGVITTQECFFLFCNRLVDKELYETIRLVNGFQGNQIDGQWFINTNWNQEQKRADIVNTDNSGRHANDVFLKNNKPWPTIDEANVMYNRGLITGRLYETILARQTFAEPGIANAYSELRNEIPGPSDLVHFAVRDCFDPSIVQAFEYNKELPIAIVPWMAKQGLGGEIGVPMPPNSTTTQGNETRTQAQWFDLYWWSHWQLPSATQGYEMLHRLYIASDYGPAPGVTPQNAFNANQLSLLLKANDYPAFWRTRFEQISYSPLTRVDVRRMYDTDVATERDVYHAYRAIGYNDGNAKLLLNFTKKLRDNRDTKKEKDATYKIAREIFLLGGSDEQTAIAILMELNYKRPNAISIVATWKSEITLKKIKETITNLKGGYMLGTFTNTDIRNAMNGMRIIPQRIVAYIELWEMIKTGKRKFLSAQTNVQHYVEGMITRNFLLYKLNNLNFDAADIQQMVAFADFTIRKKIFESNQKAAKELERMRKANIATLLKPYTDSNIKAFYKSGTMTLADIARVLSLKGWDRGTQVQWVKTYLKVDEEDYPEPEQEESEDENGDDETTGEDSED